MCEGVSYVLDLVSCVDGGEGTQIPDQIGAVRSCSAYFFIRGPQEALTAWRRMEPPHTANARRAVYAARESSGELRRWH